VDLDSTPQYNTIQYNTNKKNFITCIIRKKKKIKSKRTREAGHEARMGEKRNAYRNVVEKPEGKRPLRRPIRKLLALPPY
jgi:hypothetical protein